MELFEEIFKEKREFPKGKSLSGELSNHKYNFYQIFAICLFVVFFFLGIFFGNLFSTCQVNSFFYTDSCFVTEFNYAVMILSWFLGCLLSVFFYGLGHIIELLRSIDEKQ